MDKDGSKSISEDEFVEAIEDILPGTSYREGAVRSSSSSLTNRKRNSKRDVCSRTGRTGGGGGRQAHRNTTMKRLKIAVDIDDGTCASVANVERSVN